MGWEAEIGGGGGGGGGSGGVVGFPFDCFFNQVFDVLIVDTIVGRWVPFRAFRTRGGRREV